MSAALNYCRKIVSQFKTIAAAPSLPEVELAKINHVLDLCRASQKFILPENGVLFVDDDLRGLDDTIPLRLPHTFVAIEYLATSQNAASQIQSAGRVIFCREDEDGIYITPLTWMPVDGLWFSRPQALIPKVGYLDRTDPKNLVINAQYRKEEDLQSVFRFVKVVLGFLNVLQCSNVGIEKLPTSAKNKKIKSALPFDTYHILNIDVGRSQNRICNSAGGSHRSPREHLRRGHIVRPKDRKPFWRNATVVCSGGAGGKVVKDYQLKKRSNTDINVVNGGAA